MGQITITYTGDLMTQVKDLESGAELTTSAPHDVLGGKGGALSPTDLLGVALGSCALTLMGMKANHLKVELKGAQVIVVKEMTKTPPRKIGKLTLLFTIPHRFPLEIEEQLILAAKHCPVHHSLHPDVIQEWSFQWG